MTLRRVAFTPVPRGAAAGFDHADTYLDPQGSRLYVAHTGANRIDILSCRTGLYLGALPDLPGVAGVLIDNAEKILFSSDRAAARVSVFSCTNDSLVARVAVGAHPNGLAYDPARANLFSFNLGEPLGTDCTASVVSLGERRVAATIPLPGRPRWAVFDEQTDAVYVNISDPPLIAVIDAAALEIRSAIRVPAAGPHGMAIVQEQDRATIWCAADGRALVVLDRDSGAVRATLPLSGVPDVVMYDRESGRLYVAIGDLGVVEVFDVATRAHREACETEPGTHTIGWDPASRRLFAFMPTSCGVAVYEDAP